MLARAVGEERSGCARNDDGARSTIEGLPFGHTCATGLLGRARDHYGRRPESGSAEGADPVLTGINPTIADGTGPARVAVIAG